MALAKGLEVKHLRVFTDSMLVVKHFSEEYERRDPRTCSYATQVRENSLFFESFEISQIGRANNSRADALSRLASTETQNLTGSIYLTKVKASDIDKTQCMEIHQGINWMTPIRALLKKLHSPLTERELRRSGIGHQAITFSEASRIAIGDRTTAQMPGSGRAEARSKDGPRRHPRRALGRKVVGL